jgi:hypothetical protein
MNFIPGGPPPTGSGALRGPPPGPPPDGFGAFPGRRQMTDEERLRALVPSSPDM